MITRVLHIVGRMDRAGAETMLMNYYRSIDRNRLQFDFLVYTDDVCDYDAEIESLGGRIIRVSGDANWVGRTVSIFRILRAGNWSAVHSHTNFSSIFPLFAAFLARIPVRVAHAHGTEIETTSFAKKAYQSLAPMLVRGLATHKVACGERAAVDDFVAWLWEGSVAAKVTGVVTEELSLDVGQKLTGFSAG